MLHSKKEKNKEICMILEAWQSLAYVIPASLCFLRVINSNFRKKMSDALDFGDWRQE